MRLRLPLEMGGAVTPAPVIPEGGVPVQAIPGGAGHGPAVGRTIARDPAAGMITVPVPAVDVMTGVHAPAGVIRGAGHGLAGVDTALLT